MIFKQQQKTWDALSKPTEEEIKQLVERFRKRLQNPVVMKKLRRSMATKMKADQERRRAEESAMRPTYEQLTTPFGPCK